MRQGWARSWSTASPAGRKEGEADLLPVGYASKLPGGVERPAPIGPLGFLRTMQDSEVILWGSDKIAEADGRAHDGLLPEAHCRQGLHGAGLQPDVQESAEREVLRQARLPLADAGAVLRHRLAAAHPDPVLHRQGPGQRPQEHGRGHRRHRLLLCADALPRPGGHDQRRAGCDRLQHVARRCWPAASANCSSP